MSPLDRKHSERLALLLHNEVRVKLNTPWRDGIRGREHAARGKQFLRTPRVAPSDAQLGRSTMAVKPQMRVVVCPAARARLPGRERLHMLT